MRKWRKENRERDLENQRIWRDKNKNRLIQYETTRRLKYGPRKMSSEWRSKNYQLKKDTIIIYQREYQRRNRDKINAIQRRYYARKFLKRKGIANPPQALIELWRAVTLLKQTVNKQTKQAYEKTNTKPSTDKSIEDSYTARDVKRTISAHASVDS